MIEVRLILLNAYIAKEKQAPAGGGVPSKRPTGKETAITDIFSQVFGANYPFPSAYSAPKKLKEEDYVATFKWGHKEPNPFLSEEKAWQKLVNSPTVAVKATGKELTLIRTHFQNVPWVITQRGACEWVGEMAKFIALNFDFQDK